MNFFFLQNSIIVIEGLFPLNLHMRERERNGREKMVQVRDGRWIFLLLENNVLSVGPLQELLTSTASYSWIASELVIFWLSSLLTRASTDWAT